MEIHLFSSTIRPRMGRMVFANCGKQIRLFKSNITEVVTGSLVCETCSETRDFIGENLSTFAFVVL